jgi:hypothetical protein
LKRASRTAPHAVKMNATSSPARSKRCSVHWYTSIDGATPNETISASESICRPKALWVFVIRATRPSRVSKNIAKTISREAR